MPAARRLEPRSAIAGSVVTMMTSGAFAMNDHPSGARCAPPPPGRWSGSRVARGTILASAPSPGSYVPAHASLVSGLPSTAAAGCLGRHPDHQLAAANVTEIEIFCNGESHLPCVRESRAPDRAGL